ncbi:MAG: bifunctional hydroxymethylpyrimidine kinase/phosphomethylpyrimidine kinase [Pseudomonadota bacterium]
MADPTQRTVSPLPDPAAPSVLVIAESDPSGSAGVQGDLTTLAALGVYGMAVPTALTVRGAGSVQRIVGVSPALTQASIRAVLDELPVAAVKIGTLPDAATAAAVARALEQYAGPLVLDPTTHRVRRTRYGDRRLRDALVDLLVPRATVVTPNLNAATALCRIEVRDLEMMIAAARALVGIGAACAMVKGGGLDGDPVDVLVDRQAFSLLWGTRHHLPRTRGGGSAVSTAVAVALARGADPRAACIDARIRLDRALATDHVIGRGTPSIAHHALRLAGPTPH